MPVVDGNRLSPAARAEAQRILNSAAQRILAERERTQQTFDQLEQSTNVDSLPLATWSQDIKEAA